MQVTPEWMRMMARYNAWQNGWMLEAANGLSEADRTADRGAFFGSIAGTLSHVLWADSFWMHRFSGSPKPGDAVDGGAGNYPDWAAYRVERGAMDRQIETWAKGLSETDCAGTLRWYSGIMGRDVEKDRSHLFTHFFNHQTHHRGQVHGMLTAAGVKTEDTDLAFMELPDGV